MKKHKLNLKNLQVRSFVTEGKQIKGGDTITRHPDYCINSGTVATPTGYTCQNSCNCPPPPGTNSYNGCGSGGTGSGGGSDFICHEDNG